MILSFMIRRKAKKTNIVTLGSTEAAGGSTVYGNGGNGQAAGKNIIYYDLSKGKNTKSIYGSSALGVGGNSVGGDGGYGSGDGGNVTIFNFSRGKTITRGYGGDG